MRLGRVTAAKHLASALLPLLMACVAPASRAQSYDVSGLVLTISQSAAATGGELLKSAMVNKGVSEAIEAYRRSMKLQVDSAELQRTLKQPDGLCQTMESQAVLVAGTQAGRARASEAQRKAFTSPAGRGGGVAAVDASFAKSSEKHCSEEEARLGVCDLSTDPRYSNLAAADQDALYLFQGRSGGNTYEGEQNGPQTQAVDAYIRRVVVGVPTERLRTDGQTYKSNPQARAYVELERRYRAFLSMSSYSLDRIKESRTPSK